MVEGMDFRSVLLKVSVCGLVCPGRVSIDSRLSPVNDFHAVVSVNVAKAVHPQLCPAHSLEKIRKPYTALRTTVQNSFGRSAGHDDVSVIRYGA